MKISVNDNAYFILFMVVVFSYAAYEKFSDNEVKAKQAQLCAEATKAALAASAAAPVCKL